MLPPSLSPRPAENSAASHCADQRIRAGSATLGLVARTTKESRRGCCGGGTCLRLLRGGSGAGMAGTESEEDAPTWSIEKISCARMYASCWSFLVRHSHQAHSPGTTWGSRLPHWWRRTRTRRMVTCAEFTCRCHAKRHLLLNIIADGHLFCVAMYFHFSSYLQRESSLPLRVT